MRFVKNTAVTNDGEIAENKVYEIDEECEAELNILFTSVIFFIYIILRKN